MAGAGFKDFNSGDVLTASDVDTYLMQQTVMVFDDAAARTSALGANVAEGMFSYLKDTNLTYRYDGSSWLSDAGTTSPLTTKGDLWGYSTLDARIPVGADGTVLTADSAETLGVKWAAPAGGGGAVTQVITGATSSNQNITSTSYTDVTNLTVTITPSSVSSTILIIMGSEVGLSRGGSDRCQTQYQLLRGATSLDERSYQHIGDDGEVYESNYEGIVYKDSPATTSPVTYKIQGKVITAGETMVWASIGTIVAMELA